MSESQISTLTTIENGNSFDHLYKNIYQVNDDSISKFYKVLHNYLEHEHQIDKLNQLFSIILSFFTVNINHALPFLDDLLKNYKLNSNYVIITATILSKITYSNPKPTIPEYTFFTNAALSEILPQIREESQIKIFEHEIPPFFQNDLILDLLLISDLTDELSYNFLPYIFSKKIFLTNAKFNLLVHNHLNKFISVMPKIEPTNRELIEFISKQDLSLIPLMSKETFNFIKDAIIITETKEINEIPKDSIFPFISIILIYHQKINTVEFFSRIKINQLFNYGIKFLENNNSLLFNASIDFILKNYKYIHIHQLISDKNQYLNILVKQLIEDKFMADINGLLLVILKSFRYLEKSILKINFEKLFKIFIQNLPEIKNNIDFMQEKINLSLFDKDRLSDYIKNIKTTQELIQTLDFINNFCFSYIIKNTQEISELLQETINEKIKEKNWNDVLIIANFSRKNGFINEIQNLENIQLPMNIRDSIIKYSPKNEENIDEIMSHILASSNIEKDDHLIQFLFNKMMENEEIQQIYISYLFSEKHFSDQKIYELDDIFKVYSYQAWWYQNTFVKVVNNIFHFDQGRKLFFKKDYFQIKDLPIPEFGSMIIENLFKILDNDPSCYQALFCLKSIASSFPLLFMNYEQQIFKISNNLINGLEFLFDKNFTPEKINSVKLALLTISFLQSVFQLNIILDKFVIWFISNISNLNEFQIAGFLNIICSASCLPILAVFIKNDSIGTFSNLLNRKVKKGMFEDFYKETIFQFYYEMFSIFSNLYEEEVIQIQELSKLENPIDYYYSYIYSTFLQCQDIRIAGISKEFTNFMDSISRKRYFWLDNKREFRYYYYVDKNFLLKMIEKQNPIEFRKTYDHLRLDEPIKPIMIRYLSTKKRWLFTWFAYGARIKYTIPERTRKLTHTICALNELGNNEEFETKYDLLLPYYCQQDLYKNLLNQIHLIDFRGHYLIDLFGLFSNNPLIVYSLLELIFQYLDEIIYIPSFSINTIDVIISILHQIQSSHPCIFSRDITDCFSSKSYKIFFLPNALIQEKFIRLFKETIFIHSSISADQSFYLAEKYHDSNLFATILNINGVLNQPKEKLVFILDWCFEHYFYLNEKEDVFYNTMSKLFKLLAPKRNADMNIALVNPNSTSIPVNVKQTFPSFWNLVEKYKNKIFNLIEVKNELVDLFSFLKDYIELCPFQVRVILFRKKIKSKIGYSPILRLEIDRKNILESSIESFFGKSPEKLLGEIKIKFIGERGIDMGGLTREWFSELTKSLFNQNYCLFDCSLNKRSYQPSHLSFINQYHLEYFKFAGKFIAKAIIQGQCIEAHFTKAFWKNVFDQELNMKDIEDVDAELYRSFVWMLENDVDSLEMDFTVTADELGEIKVIPLKKNGQNILLTNENKKEFIQLKTNYILKKRIKAQIKAFREGFFSLIPKNEIEIFTPNEIDLLVCGIPEIDPKDFLENIEFCFPLNKNSSLAKMFCNVVSKWDSEKIVKLLLFMTGSSGIPAGGFKEFCLMSKSSLKIELSGDSKHLPQSHTCFNTLCLPSYDNEEQLSEKLLMAINECNTFELA